LAVTVENRGSQASELLQIPDDLSRWCVQAKLVETPPEVNESDLEAARALREAIYHAALARRDERVPASKDRELINAWATLPPLVPQLSQDGRTCSRTAHQPIKAILAMVARDAIELFASSEVERLKVCAQPACASLFLDASRSHLRRWCSMNTCGNKAKKTTHRVTHKKNVEQEPA
jgi:predicted RNA-binding Zn ribbon-like protein